eukprot:gene10455-10614_t
MLYGCVELPKPKTTPHISQPTMDEHARRRAWQAEKQAMRERRLAQEAARKQREEAVKAAAAAARVETHRKLMEDRKAKYEAFKAKEAALFEKSEAAWKHFQEQRGRPPLFKLMEQDFQERLHAEAAAKRAAYEAEVAAGKLATVSQLVKGEVVVRPPPVQGNSSSSPGRSHSPGAIMGVHSAPGGETVSKTRGSCSGTTLAGQKQNVKQLQCRDTSSDNPAGPFGKHKWPGASGASDVAIAAAPSSVANKQLIDRASSPLVMLADGSPPPGVKVVRTRLYVASDSGTPDVRPNAVDENVSDKEVEEELQHSEYLSETEVSSKMQQQLQDQELPEELESVSYPVCMEAEQYIQGSENDKEEAEVVQDGGDDKEEPEACRGSGTESEVSEMPEEVAVQEP